MPNPLNPLEWIKSTQDWFAKAEKSSGFRPYLIYLIISTGTGFCLLVLFKERQLVEALGVILIAFPILSFIPLYTWKAHTDPNFCRSESHVHRMKKIELENMGTESKQIQGDIYEENAIQSIKEPPLIIQQNKNDRRGE